MVEEYFSKTLKKLNVPSSILETTKTSLFSVNKTVCSQLTANTIPVAPTRKQFKKAKSKPDLSSPPIINKELHKQKVGENAKFVLQLKRERDLRQQRENERRLEFLHTLQSYETDLSKRQEELARLKQDQVTMKLQNMRAKHYKRREENSNLKKIGDEDYKRVANTVPLYKKMEENYKLQVVLPELEKKKAELAKKRIIYQPMSLEEIKEHAEKYDQFTAQASSHRNKNVHKRSIEGKIFLSTLPKSQYRETVLQELKERTNYEASEKNKKKELFERRFHYSQLVKEMYQPTIDTNKQRELEIIKEKLKHTQNSRVTKSVSETGKEGGSSLKKRQWKKNPMVPLVPDQRDAVVVDYLAERRNARKQLPQKKYESLDIEQELSGLDNTEKMLKLRKLAKSIEKQAFQEEALLGNIKVDDLKGIERADNVNELLMNSIRAKLALLESTNLR